MTHKLLLALTFLSLFSCAQINRDSRERYEAKQPPKHGIVLLNAQPADKNEVLKEKLDEASVARGKVLYNNNCLSCHGEKGLGNGPEAAKQPHAPANLNKLAKQVKDFKFFMSISQWQGDMPGWKEQFNEADREDLVSYIKSFRLN